MQYEYKKVYIGPPGAVWAEDRLNELGQESWLLITVLDDYGYFMRPVEEIESPFYRVKIEEE